MNITYRSGVDVDTKHLDSLWSAIGWTQRGSKKWKEVLSKSYFMCTAWAGDNLIGSGRIVEDGIMCMFYDIGIHPNYQRKGIGTKLLKVLIDQVKDKRYASIGLFSWEENIANIPFYEKHGFIKTSGMELIKYMKPE